VASASYQAVKKGCGCGCAERDSCEPVEPRSPTSGGRCDGTGGLSWSRPATAAISSDRFLRGRGTPAFPFRGVSQPPFAKTVTGSIRYWPDILCSGGLESVRFKEEDLGN
jgi:hypothetical protein